MLLPRTCPPLNLTPPHESCAAARHLALRYPVPSCCSSVEDSHHCIHCIDRRRRYLTRWKESTLSSRPLPPLPRNDTTSHQSPPYLSPFHSASLTTPPSHCVFVVYSNPPPSVTTIQSQRSLLISSALPGGSTSEASPVSHSADHGPPTHPPSTTTLRNTELGGGIKPPI